MLEYDELTRILYQENINWIYSIVKELDAKDISPKETFISDPYKFNNLIALGYYFMNLYVVSNIKKYTEEDADQIMTAIIKGASSYNQYKLSKVYKTNLNLNKIVEAYNSIVRKTKAYSPNDGLKARVVAIDEVYRKIYPKFYKEHFNIFIKFFMSSFFQYEESIQQVIDSYLNKDV